jgi:hypothetical protein
VRGPSNLLVTVDLTSPFGCFGFFFSLRRSLFPILKLLVSGIDLAAVSPIRFHEPDELELGRQNSVLSDRRLYDHPKLDARLKKK